MYLYLQQGFPYVSMKANWPITILFLIIGGLLGYYGNVAANRRNNVELIAMLKVEQLVINARLENGRLSNAEQLAFVLKDIALQNQIDKIKKLNLL